MITGQSYVIRGTVLSDLARIFGGIKNKHYLCTIICVTIKFEIMEYNIPKEELLALVKSKIYTIRGQKVMRRAAYDS